MQRSRIIQACERVNSGIAITFRDGPTYLFHDQTLLEIRDTVGRQVTSATEEDEEGPATA
jgi:hypothetical protein